MLKRYWAILILAWFVIQSFPTTACADEAAPGSTARIIAVVRQRIETDRLEVRVYQGKKLVHLAPFMEMFVVTPVPGQPRNVENLANHSVAIVRSEKEPGRLEVFQDFWVGTGREQTLADNVFRVKQVFVSSAQSPIELRLDERVVRLEPGDAILVL